MAKAFHLSKVFPDKDLHRFAGFIRSTSHTRKFILCDSNTQKFCLEKLLMSSPELRKAVVICIPAGEKNKSLRSAERIWKALLKAQAGRDALLVNLGGGMICDLGGFAASVYMRGIDFVNVPTSLLGMTDACIGGKTAIDFLSVKNPIGTFASASRVFLHTGFLETLPPRQRMQGRVEMLKVACISDQNLWNKLKTGTTDSSLIIQAVNAKMRIVKADPKEKGKRKLLNFGHSVGHALEASYLTRPGTLFHGEAVAAGMIIESAIALHKKLLSIRAFDEIVVEIRKTGLPFLREIDQRAVFHFLSADKKNRSNQLLFALPTGIGKGKFDVRVNRNEILRGLAFYRSLT
jgi:3-dehydroquinate synthetase